MGKSENSGFFNEAVLTCTENLCFVAKFSSKIIIFKTVKKCNILHRRVFVII